MRIIMLVVLTIFFTACGSGNKSTEGDFETSLDSAQSDAPPLDRAVLGEILQQIPAPLEISVLLKESGQKYNATYLNSPDNLPNYNSNFQKALNLGIYGTDLGYTNIYEQNQDGVKYMGAIKDLADDLSIGQFFDIETIGRLATNSSNLDSLLLITTQNFNNINQYLQTQNRESLSVLLLTGGWLEALHIVSQVSAATPNNKQLRETIGEQKIILENIILLLTFYEQTDQNMASLLKDMKELKALYEKVKITYVYKESTFEIVDGVMVIKDNSTSTIEITEDDVKNIKTLTTTIRNKYIS
ncbi:hypothetical protein [Pseudochryseolinea flava]|uniref:Uncharacterized protein n=1 Tax=Pseudochryseolinea flava TaxID=2059302 RepID=A0A364XYQ1_9BACT|nr:hypothetical protein [Pseudochryseolinea flava]RAV99115.1 hypothetical protein DQQ10_21205 [Pseudochryseolinea flava]